MSPAVNGRLKGDQKRPSVRVKGSPGLEKGDHFRPFPLPWRAGSLSQSRVGTRAVLRFLVAFLLTHDLLETRQLQFFVDGSRSLHAEILRPFQGWFPSVRSILDWFHREKKCGEKLSSTMRGASLCNAAKDLLPILWPGQIARATAYVQALWPEQIIRSPADQPGLVGYLECNRPYIPCYALRKAFDLKNSSKPGEKACVASRQKHHGMSWCRGGSGLASKPGSAALV